MSDFLSQKFKFYGFLAMLLLVFVHGYNLQDTYLQPWSIVNEPMTFTTFTEYLLANGLFRFRIPILFLISGFLYSLTDHKTYKERSLKRLRTLGIPYVFWSFFALLMTYLLELVPVFEAAIRSSWLAAIDENTRTVHGYSWEVWIVRSFLFPVPFQMWFIRVLLIFNLAYPALLWCVLKIPKIWFPLTFFLWFFGAAMFPPELSSLFFFTLGIWAQKNNFDLENAPKYLKPSIFLPLFLVLAFGKTYLAFQGESFLYGHNPTVIGVMHRFMEFSGMIGMWYGMDWLVSWASKNVVWQAFQPFSFIIYAFHVPILYYAMHYSTALVSDWQYHRLANFVIVPLLIIGLAMLIGWFLRLTAPKVYSFITGGRGF